MAYRSMFIQPRDDVPIAAHHCVEAGPGPRRLDRPLLLADGRVDHVGALEELGSRGGGDQVRDRDAAAQKTPNPELLGKAVSHGCVRMRNEDVVRVYERVELGTTVIVEP